MSKLKKSTSKQEADVTIWSVHYFNPIATRETEQFKRDAIKAIKFLAPISYEFEELTAFLILRVHLNSTKSFEKNKLQKPDEKELMIKEILRLVNEKIDEKYSSYLQALTNRFLKEMKKNQELKESTNILIKKLSMSEDEKGCFATNIYEKIEKRAEAYYEVIQNSSLSLSDLTNEKLSYIQLREKDVTITSEKSVMQLLDELILYNFSQEYTMKTQNILDQFTKCLSAVNKRLKKVKEKSTNFEELFDLLKGKSFEVLDNIFDLRRQIARQNRAEREINSETEEIGNSDLNQLISDLSSKDRLQKIVKLTDNAIEDLAKWSDYIRKLELLDKVNEEMTISEDFTNEICDLFINMELLRIWSEFFYDISYYTVKKGRVLDAPDVVARQQIETDAVLVVDDVYKTYKLPKSRVYALRGVSFEITAGEFLAIMGPSGAGKTTLMNIMTGLDTPDKGAVYLNGKNMALFDDYELTVFRRDEIGIVFQFYQLFAELTALENISMPAEMAGIPVKEARAKAKELLEVVDLGSFGNQYPDKLSGGQQQRVAIARSLINDPSIIVADQLTGDLDSVTGMQIIGYLRKINEEKGTTVLLVSHNKTVATQADRILTIEDGEIVEEIDMTLLRQADE